MNLRDLQYLVAVAEERHFGRAADACHVSQPTLSGQIRKLETRLGVPIFERTNRSVSTTPAGEDIVECARRVMVEVDRIRAIADARRDPLSAPFRLGVIPTLSPYLMPLVLRPLRERHPRLKLVLIEEVTDSLLRRLRAHEIDAALLATPASDDDPALAETALFDEPFWIAHNLGDPLNEVEEIDAGTLARLDLLLLADGHCLSDQVAELCGRPDAAEGELADFRASSLETLLQLVGAGFGCTLVPALAIGGPWMTDLGVVARPLGLEGARRRVRLVYRRSFPNPRVLDAVREVIVAHLPNTVRRAPPPDSGGADGAGAGAGSGPSSTDDGEERRGPAHRDHQAGGGETRRRGERARGGVRGQSLHLRG